MKIKEFLDQTDLERCLLIGYYGGGNFGDELLLEVLQNQLSQRAVKNARFVYSSPDRYRKYHHDFGYQPVTGNQSLVKALFASRSLVIGGGGLWGMDVNLRVFVMSLMLFLARYLLGKRVYLIGVGYYNSTGKLGHISAWLAGKAANVIIARDSETRANFGRIKRSVSIDRDIAFLIEGMNLGAYQKEADQIGAITEPKIYITLRHFRHTPTFNKLVERVISDNPNASFLIGLMQPAIDYPEGDTLIRRLTSQYPNVQSLDANINPLALTSYFFHNRKNLRFITPQFHAIVIAQIAGIEALPIAYDNKVKSLLEAAGATPTALYDIEPSQLATFVEVKT